MLDKILKRFGYIKEKKKEDLEIIEKKKSLEKQFNDLMHYSLKNSIKGGTNGR